MKSRYGRYEVLYMLGQGAMAKVFLARDPVLSRYVAVKVLHAEVAARKDVLQRFFNEARTVAVVRNPHVVEVFDFGQEGNDLYLVMEFIDGLSLQGVLRQLGHAPGRIDRSEAANGSSREAPVFSEPLDSNVAAALMCQAAEGLTMAAQHGVVHRDIKPENLMINSQGYLKISDFGIAHVQDASLTKTGVVLGSPLFMSPEQARGRKPITSQADMFSLGAVFYACLAGRPPFQAKTLTELFRKITTEAHAPLWRLRPDVDPALGNLLEILLRKDPAERGNGPRWLHRQLKAYLMALGVMDPAELVGAYLHELSAKGVQTTWRLDAPDQAGVSTQPAGAMPPGAPMSGRIAAWSAATERITGERSRQVPAAAFGAVLGILALAAGGAIWGFMRHASVSAPNREAQPEDPHPTVGQHVTFASFLPVHDSDGDGRPSLAGSDSAAPQGSAQGSNPALSAGERGDGQESAQPQPALATLILKSSPPFAEAFVDGRFVGVTPVRVELPADMRHRIVITSRNIGVYDTLLALRPGRQEYKIWLGEREAARLAVTPEAER